MSKQVNLDLSDLESNDVNDLQYALDRKLIPMDERQRVFDFIQGQHMPDLKDPEDPEDAADGDSPMAQLLKGSVGEVHARLDEYELTDEDIEQLRSLEAGGKDRKGVYEYLDAAHERNVNAAAAEHEGDGEGGGES